MSAGPEFDLSDKYRRTEGRILLGGVQALVRVLFDQVRADRRRGLRTGTFVSGYPGSPLGGFDQTLSATGPLLAEHDIHWVPGVNEDLAAAAVWGSQQDNLAPLAQHDGVIGMWYGKAPGVDRCGDVFRHANLHGVGRNGGVLCAVGDDPQSKSSTLPSSSEVALYDAGMPILVPGTLQELLDLGRHGFELSRWSGCWTGFKIVTALADAFGSAEVSPERIAPRIPELFFGGERWRFAQVPRLFLPDTIALEGELYERRLAAASAYAAENRLDVIDVDPPTAWISILSYGRTYRELRQALADLGLADDAALRAAGIRLVRLGMIHPVDRGIVRAAARGVEELLVVEEKRPFVERFVREILYGAAHQPQVVGKRDARDEVVLPLDGELNADRLRPILARRLARRLSGLAAPLAGAPIEIGSAELRRSAAFCSGCPHNRSTFEASSSPVGGGVGCHALALWMDRGTVSYTHMGGEGANWIGRAPFTEVPHFVQNVGDGTFFHSGSLAVRAAVAAGATLTFKILYNGVVAMTGGQDPVGQLAIPDLCALLAAEGVTRTLVVSEEPDKYRDRRALHGAEVWPRERLHEAERALAGVSGVTVLVYEQACAAQLRRLRKRGKAPMRSQRVVINEAVCEGCGDCGAKSACLSVHPVDTELGRKTQIDQSSCNSDYGCLDGDCPSFVTLDAPEVPRPVPIPALPADIPEPARRAEIPAAGDYGVVAAGIGGTGVVTLNQILATAAFLEGLHVSALDQTGLSQKAGPVVSHLRLSRAVPVLANRVSEASADLLLALDLLVATDVPHLSRALASRTATVASTSLVPTASMVRAGAPPPRVPELLERVQARTRPGRLVALDCVALSLALFGDTVQANLIALGAAYQAGELPLAARSIERALELNGVAVERNVAAFRAGRLAVCDPERLPRHERPGAQQHQQDPADLAVARSLAVERRVEGRAVERAAELVAYQDARLARRYLDLVAAAQQAERPLGGQALGDAVTDAFFHLLAYKDEYEVARLHLRPEFASALERAVPAGAQLRYRLHPPFLRALGMQRKLAVPAWLAHPLFRALRGLRGLRGSAADPFGYASLRRLERRLAAQYEDDLHGVLARLSSATHASAVELARLPLEIRGYEEIKRAAIQRFESERQKLLSRAAD